MRRAPPGGSGVGRNHGDEPGENGLRADGGNREGWEVLWGGELGILGLGDWEGVGKVGAGFCFGFRAVCEDWGLKGGNWGLEGKWAGVGPDGEHRGLAVWGEVGSVCQMEEIGNGGGVGAGDGGIVVSEEQRGMRGLGGPMRGRGIGTWRENGDRVGLGGHCCLGENTRGLVLGGEWSL